MGKNYTEHKEFEHDLLERSERSAIRSNVTSDRPYSVSILTVDELLERDKRREEDGFPRKIRVGRMIKPGKGDKDKIV
ncbi:MAG TPA: hypothetical protein VKA69_03605, partial [Desulfobacteria bacterium]|nr:hypothetical protein [Desulfobacteria bacterium]